MTEYAGKCKKTAPELSFVQYSHCPMTRILMKALEKWHFLSLVFPSILYTFILYISDSSV